MGCSKENGYSIPRRKEKDYWLVAEKRKKSYRCPKFDGDAKQTLEIRVERKRNLKLGELGEVSF